MAQKTFKINEVINIEENNTLSLINENLQNMGTVVIKDLNVDVYYPNGEHEDYKQDFQKLLDKVEENGWCFIKLLKGDTRWKEFNPNPKAKRVDDCSIRAYCKANDLSWDEAFDIACKVAKEEKDIINSGKVCHKIITEKLGWTLNEESKKVKTKDRETVQEFCLKHNYGKYILHVRGHLVTVVDGFFYDTWNSGEKKVTHFYEKN